MSPSRSKSQQHYLGMVYGAKKAGKQLSGAAGKTEKGMSLPTLKDFANTSTRGLPNKIAKTDSVGKIAGTTSAIKKGKKR